MICSHKTACAIYRSPRWLPVILRALRSERYEDSAWPSPAPTCHEAREAARTLGIEGPLEVLIASSRSRNVTPDLKTHLWSGELPPRALIRVTGTIIVPTPGFLLMQLAANAPLEATLMLAEELTGRYAIPADSTQELMKRPALLSPKELEDYLRAATGMHGAARAQTAARHVLGGARSPKEAALGLLLALPRRLGGRGVPDVVLNQRVELDRAGQTIAGRSYLIADALSLALQRVYEYDSNDHHLSRRAHEADERKRNAYARTGFKLTVVTAGQLHTWKVIDALLQECEREANPRLFPPSEAIRAKQYRLWHALVRTGRTREDNHGDDRELPPTSVYEAWVD